MIKNVAILGAGESGFGAAMLASKKGYNVFVSDLNCIDDNIKLLFEDNSIEYEENDHSIDKIKYSDLIIKSPGIPDTSDIIVKIKSLEIPIISEIEFASNNSNSFKICITGTNGKTTTTNLIYNILKNAGLSVGIAGNVGDSFSKMLLSGDKDIYVLEISSFQLDNIKNFKPNISVITNVLEDHLDRYDFDFSKYIDAKMKIISNQDNSDYLIYNADDKQLVDALDNQKSTVKRISYGIENQNKNLINNKKNILSNKKKNNYDKYRRTCIKRKTQFA